MPLNRNRHSGMVKQHKIVEIKVREAPGAQSSPTSLGKIMVFIPQGMARIISEGIIKLSRFKSFRINPMEQGITSNRIATMR